MKKRNKVDAREILKKIKYNFPLFLLIGIILLIIIIVAIYYVFMYYAPINIIEQGGYAIQEKQLSKNLENSNFEEVEKTVNLLKVEEQDTIYERLGNYYIQGDGNKCINSTYPIYLNENSALLNINSEMNLITTNFEEVGGYPNFMMVEGKMYNKKDYTRADDNEYLFLKNSDNIYINVRQLTIKTDIDEYEINVNSSIYFNEKYITYYNMQENKELKYNAIKEIDSSSIIKINSKEYTYEEFLINLKVLEKEEKKEEESIIIDEPINEITENKIEKPETNKEEVNDDNNSNTEFVYIEPEVTMTDFKANVYTAITNISIYDPSGRISTPVIITIMKDDKVYQRRQTLVGGTIEVLGLLPDSQYTISAKYNYKNKQNKTKEKIIYEGKMKTESINTLGNLKLSFNNGEIYNNKIEIKDFKIENESNDQILRGLSKIEVEINDIKYKLKTSQVTKMISGEAIKYQTEENVKSNSNIKYKISAYDMFGNKLNVENNSGNTRTAKLAPTITLTTKKQETTQVVLSVNMKNNDNVEISNYYYEVYDQLGKKIAKENLEKSEKQIKLEGLDPNKAYVIKIYMSYDLGDSIGHQKDVMIVEAKFTSMPISSLGYLTIEDKVKNIQSEQVTISLNIDQERTDSRLIDIISAVQLKIYSEDEKEEHIENLSIQELIKLQQQESTDITFNNLKSKTNYKIEIIAKAKQGTVEEQIGINFETTEFITNKYGANVLIKNQFVTGEMIDFDVKVEDTDGSILNNVVKIEVRDEKLQLISLEEIRVNSDYIRKTYNKLDANKTYEVTLYAEQYNEGHTDETYNSNFTLRKFDIYTEEGISGQLSLTDLKKKETGKNLVDMSSETKWYVYPNFNTGDHYGKTYDSENKILTIGYSGNTRRCVYDLREYAGQTVTMSFKAKLVGSESSGIYIQNAKTDKNYTRLTGLSTSEWKEYTYTMTVDSSGYLGFRSSGSQGVQIKELQIELGSRQTYYQEYKYNLEVQVSVNITDKRNEITTDDYYIRIYKNNEVVQEKRYEEIDENNKVENIIKEYQLQEDAEYKIELVIKIRDREYVLYTQQFETEKGKEIKGIYSKQDFLEVQPNGNYIVFTDLDLTDTTGNKYRFGYGSQTDPRLTFNGTIDFNGHSIDRNFNTNTDDAIFYMAKETAVIKNLIINVKMDNEIEVTSRQALFLYNYGTISNIQLNLEESTNVPNVSIRLLGYLNVGTIENFVINLQSPLYGARVLSAGVQYNYGTIKNGYIYGQNVEATHAVDPGATKAAAGIVGWNQRNGVIKNVYSLINVDVGSESDVTKIIGNIVAYNEGNATVEKVYSIGTGDSDNLNYGPTLGQTSNQKYSNVYYFTDKIFKNTYNLKTTKVALKDSTFQNQMLNDENGFNVDELITQGYYPQVNMSAAMPRQEYIQLPETTNADLPDILATEVLEQGTDTVKVRFSVNNPSGERIIDIRIANLTTKIESQDYEDGKSNVYVTLYNPVKYVSSYDVLSITTRGAFNLNYTRQFEAYERMVNVDFYKEINSISDWKSMSNSLAENYMLTKDLDFANEANTIRITGTYTGKINGNGHIIKNINVTTGGLFNIVKGTIENLRIKNFTYNNATGDYTSIIQRLNIGILDNVHVDGVEITAAENRNGGTLSAGGLVGYIDGGAEIRNSSVSNVSITSTAPISTVRIGGIASVGNNYGINNCYAYNVNLTMKKASTSQGIGGIVGYGSPGYISNCYATGKIFTDANDAGGIIGYNTTGGSVKNCYSLVDVESEAEYVGGIIGYRLEPQNCLAIGNIYVKQQTTKVGRISGYDILTEKNYAYKNQRIGGYVEEDNMDATALLTQEQLLTKSTYTNTIQLGDYYNYDELSKGILPKLYNTDGVTLLPNQPDNKIVTNNQIKIDEVEAQKTNVTTVSARVVVNNPENLEITEIKVEYMNTKITQNIYQNGKSYIGITATPTKYYDSYKINKVIYKESGVQKEVDVEAKIEITFYKEIYNFEDWQSIEEDTYQNYMLMNDIDFEGRENVKVNVTIARLEAEGTSKALKNLTIKNLIQNQAFINKISINIQNIIFENINITTTASGNYIGVIGKALGIIDNVKFKNITVDAKNMSYVGCIAETDICTYPTNITLDTVNCYGVHYVGGFIGRCSSPGTNIKANNITIVATGSYVGGIVGRVYTNDDTIKRNISITNSNIKGKGDYVGGLAGIAYSMVNCYVTNVNIEGTRYVGGAYGLEYDSSPDEGEVIVKDSTIKGSGNSSAKQGYIGGFAGQSSDWASGMKKVEHCTIIGTTTNANSVGGIFGYGNARVIGAYIYDSTVTSLGDNVGGLIGYCNRDVSLVEICFIENVDVQGKSNVGGSIGYLRAGRMQTQYFSGTVTATSSNAGGLVGYIENTDMTAVNHDSAIIQNYVANTTVTSPEYAGGLVGRIENELYLPNSFYANNYVEANIVTNADKTASILIGNKDMNTQLINTYAYKNSTINGKNIDAGTNNISTSKLLTLADLTKQTTYTSKIKFSTSYYRFTELSKGKYPTITYSRGEATIKSKYGVDLPVETQALDLNTMTLDENEFLVEENTMAKANFFIMLAQVNEEKLPTYEAYPISANQINIDFSDITQGAYFEYYVDGQKTERIYIDRKTYTFKYDFKTNIEITIGINSTTASSTIKPTNVARKTSLIGNTKAYLQGTTLIMNAQKINGEYVNLYKGQALSADGSIYDIQTGVISKQNGENIVYVEQETKPRETYTYNSNQIQVYGRYSTINGNEKAQTYIVKNGKLYVIDKTVKQKIGEQVVDNYNGNEYQTILATDGKMYNLKQTIKYPENFSNKNIEEISANLSVDKTEVMVLYKNGKVIVFSYMTGEEKYRNNTSDEEAKSLFEYIKEKLTQTSDLYSNINEEYEESQKIKEKLETTPISNFNTSNNEFENVSSTTSDNTNNVTNLDQSLKESSNTLSQSQQNYISVYNGETQNYEIYKEEELLKSTSKEPVSETSKIERDEELSKYYLAEQGKAKDANSTNGTIWVILSIGGVIISLGIIYRINFIKNKKNQKNLKRKTSKSK